MVDLRAATTAGSRSRRSSLKKSHSEIAQPQPPRGRSMSSASEGRYANAVPSRPQSTSRTTPLPPPPPLSASAPASAAPRSPYTQRVPLPTSSGTVIVNAPPSQVHVQRGASTRGGAAGAFVSQADRGKPRRSSSASRHTPATTPTTPTSLLPVPSSNIKLRNRTAKEQVMYIPSGQPLVIVGTQF